MVAVAVAAVATTVAGAVSGLATKPAELDAVARDSAFFCSPNPLNTGFGTAGEKVKPKAVVVVVGKENVELELDFALVPLVADRLTLDPKTNTF